MAGRRRLGVLWPNAMGSALLAIATLFHREIVRFYRQPGRVIGSVATPLLFWLMLGGGIGRSFRAPTGEASYIAYLLPGMLVMTVLFTAIFSTISIIEDRQAGFLQGALVAPVGQLAVIGAKVLAGVALAVLQAALLLGLAPAFGIELGWSDALSTLGALALVATALTAVGFAMAWYTESVQAYHSGMNVLLAPLWFLSGAVFPAAGAAAPLRWAITLNPLSYGVALVRALLAGQAGAPLSWVVSVAFALGAGVLALLATRRPSRWVTA